MKCSVENDGKRFGMGENVLLFFVKYDMIYVFQGMFCFLLGLRERKLRLWNSFDSTNSLFPNRNFSSNEWMTEFLFCSAFKTPCKQASMQTSLCLYLNDLWSECFCLVMAVRLRVFVVFWKGSWEDFLYCKSKISILCNDDGWTWISVFSFFVL